MCNISGAYPSHFHFISFTQYPYLISSCFLQVYIVYLGLNQFHDPIVTSNFHIQLLSNVFASEEEAKQSLLYSYKHSFSGFSAMLNSTQAITIANMKGVISVFRSKTLELHTTRSWDFLGLTLDCTTEATPLQLSYGDNVVVGVFDSGIWPESDSFKEEPCLWPIPPSWKGQCVKGEGFEPRKACNRKLIGARYYLKGFEQQFGPLNKSCGNSEYRSARDFLGHGTHTASTAVGSIVKNGSFFGFGQGTARGGAPRARLAVYKICWGKNLEGKCAEADILAAFEDALRDGVHIISASFGSPPPLAPFFFSSADIGSFHAMQFGVSVVFSAGNDGPAPSLVGNVSPWSICVAASTIDRTFPTQIVLGSDFSVTGESFITKEIKGKLANAEMYFTAGICMLENWTKKSATGKIILCFSNIGPIPSSEIAQKAVKTANGLALIFVEPPTNQIADVDIIPTVRVDISQGTQIQYYLAQFPKLPVVRILPSRTVIGKSPAPVVAPFSSRGPSSISPDFLKPDLTAPGINILAAWPPKTPPTLMPSDDDRSVNWNFQSGTSMSCPHVSGVAALIKSAHPHWSPAAIRSALMTTASTRDTTLDSILAGGSMEVSDPFDIGSGHINPLKAMDPGLVYDMKTRDYIIFLCNIGYTQEQIKKMILPSPGTDITCCSYLPKTNMNMNINYPSITVSNLQSSTTIKRTVRNVGTKKNAIYFVRIVKPNGVEVVVWPRVLIFSCFKEEFSYYVTLKPLKKSQGRYDFGEIVWSDGFHYVRSPLVVVVNTIGGDDSAIVSSI
ncbi:subtilisin-like protease SBT3.18 isoform X2 [Hevea brasiliensis]|uniref:subtilisin-like protease SBT3.18 isoform X2 n=1 Tax=Hevea brasiliensis TaxID=3981 RepID=UPI0025D4009A|nr:subtilisin-like protease SBT3.18 isoform X2 [Hevea brasiliensis]